MTLPKVVIVGRPNVGKSSLFNWLVGRRMSIVDPTAGVTRDWVSDEVDSEHGRTQFTLVDTGGMGIIDSDDLTDDVENQIQTAIDMADVILFVVDGREGVVSLDEHVASHLRKLSIPILCIVNKTDHAGLTNNMYDFHRFGWEVLPVSAKEKKGREELLDLICANLPARPKKREIQREEVMKIAIVGRRNTGKSTFVNTLVKFPRMIVSDVAGTTRDSVNVRFELDGRPFVAVDTPGFRRRVSVKTNIDYYGTHRAKRSIRYADVTLLFFDSTVQISKVDKQLVGYIAEENKPCMFVVNKWDLMKDRLNTEDWANYLHDTFPTMWHVPIAFITGQTGKNVKVLLHYAQRLYKQSLARVSTSRLNKLVRAALSYNPPPLYRTSRPKIYYATQTGVQPPTVVLFCNNPDMFPPTYRRYLLSVMRDKLEFGEIPIRLFFRKREMSDTRDDVDSKLAATVRQTELEEKQLLKQRELEEWSRAEEFYADKVRKEMEELDREDRAVLESDGTPDFLDDSDFSGELSDEELEVMDFEDESELDEEFDLSDETFRQHNGEVVIPEDDPEE